MLNSAEHDIFMLIVDSRYLDLAYLELKMCQWHKCLHPGSIITRKQAFCKKKKKKKKKKMKFIKGH